ncbi:TfdD [Diaphorobacter sp. JS3050]|nr:dichloromuconate cycloisomerase [Diaphorobacter sp.]QJY34937.1 TfdD [Diaphorobacter sp. JS3050]
MHTDKSRFSNESCVAADPIESIETRIVDLPLKKVHNHSTGTHLTQSLVLVTLRTKHGATGYGEGATPAGTSFWGGECSETIKQVIDCYLAPAVCGIDIFAHESILKAMDRASAANNFAKAAVDVAVHDAVGKLHGLPVSALYGGRVRTSIPVLWALASGDLDSDVEDAKRQLEARRHRTFKMKIGMGDASKETARAIQTAEAVWKVEPTAVFTVDLNQAWDEPTCMRFLPRLESAGFAMIEQPLPRWNHEGMARVAARMDIPISADEGLWDFHDAYTSFKACSTDLYGVKVGKGGGIRRAYKAAAVAEAAGVPIYGSMALESSIGTAAGLQLFSALPEMPWGCEMIGPLLLADDLTTVPISYCEYEVVVPNGCGLGVELDHEKIEHYSREK